MHSEFVLVDIMQQKLIIKTNESSFIISACFTLSCAFPAYFYETTCNHILEHPVLFFPSSYSEYPAYPFPLLPDGLASAMRSAGKTIHDL
jgi:hypothetical protein